MSKKITTVREIPNVYLKLKIIPLQWYKLQMYVSLIAINLIIITVLQVYWEKNHIDNNRSQIKLL